MAQRQGMLKQWMPSWCTPNNASNFERVHVGPFLMRYRQDELLSNLGSRGGLPGRVLEEVLWVLQGFGGRKGAQGAAARMSGLTKGCRGSEENRECEDGWQGGSEGEELEKRRGNVPACTGGDGPA